MYLNTTEHKNNETSVQLLYLGNFKYILCFIDLWRNIIFFNVDRNHFHQIIMNKYNIYNNKE